MFFDFDIRGGRLPPRTLCLTYDDGPGSETAELGAYLCEQNIAATFFVVGSHAAARPQALRSLQACGHLVANHTYTHPGLVALALAGGDVVGELVKTDQIIHEAISSEVTYFRPPYGNWRESDNGRDRPTSVVASLLNASGRFRNYVGPINWDINPEDYDFWRHGAAPEECARACLYLIQRAGHGILLLHDSSEDEIIRRNNRTFEVTQMIVPVLRKKGYHFVRLDAIPQVQEVVAVSRWLESTS